MRLGLGKKEEIKLINSGKIFSKLELSKNKGSFVRNLFLKQFLDFFGFTNNQSYKKYSVFLAIPENSNDEIICAKFNNFGYMNDEQIIEYILKNRSKEKALKTAEVLGCCYKSPFSSSYYNDPKKDWDYTSEGCIRISDHWNFETKGSRHAVLKNYEDRNETIQKWIAAEYKNGKYEILEIF